MGNTEKRKKMKGSWQSIVAKLPALAAGVIIGMEIVDYMGILMILSDSFLLILCLMYAILLVTLLPAVLIQTIVHESGHMIFGWMTGYKLVSFRIRKWMVIRQDGSWKWKHLHIRGTAGQCLMDPPDFKDGKIPYKLYLMGGSILNLVVSVFCLIPYVWINERSLIKIFFLAMSCLGFSMAFANGVPFRLREINNDGYNVRNLGKRPQALRAFWVILKSNAHMAQGKQMKDLPEAWYPIPPIEYFDDSIIVNHAITVYTRLLEQGKIKEAQALSDLLLEHDAALIGNHFHMLICDKIFFELISENRKEIVDQYMDKKQKRFMKAMRSYPAVIRLNYAYAMLYQKDAVAAKRYKDYFEKIARKYPYPEEIEAERKLMEHIEKHALEQHH